MLPWLYWHCFWLHGCSRRCSILLVFPVSAVYSCASFLKNLMMTAGFPGLRVTCFSVTTVQVDPVWLQESGHLLLQGDNMQVPGLLLAVTGQSPSIWSEFYGEHVIHRGVLFQVCDPALQVRNLLLRLCIFNAERLYLLSNVQDTFPAAQKNLFGYKIKQLCLSSNFPAVGVLFESM